MWRIVEYRALL